MSSISWTAAGRGPRRPPPLVGSANGAPNERELGLTPSDLEFLAGEAAQIPFEPAMLGIARLAAANWHISARPRRPTALADDFFDGAPIVAQLRLWAQAEEGRVVFSEQQFFVV